MPVPLGNGIYSIGSGPAAGEGLANQTYQRAIRFCFDQGRQLVRVDGPGDARPSSAGGMQFRCVGPGEPGWKDPVG
jgi:hypothetical protein